MEQRAQEELLNLFADALKVGGAAIEMRIRRFVSLVRPSDAALAGAMAPLVSGTRALRREMPLPGFPIDVDSKLSLVRVETSDGSWLPPVLPAALKADLDRVIKERAAASRLLDAGLTPVRSVLMSGPPGVGKTMSAKWLAQQLALPLCTLDLASVMSSFLGKTGSNLRAVLNHAQQQPCVLFLDEFDAIAKRRNDDSDVGELKRLVTVILQAIDEWSPLSLLVAATNHGELLDPAVWRRFDVTVTFEMPDHEQRTAFLISRGVSDPLVELISVATEGQSLSALSRAVDASRKQAVLGEQQFELALITWAIATLRSSAVQVGSKAEKTKRDIEVLMHHASGLPTREIATLVGSSHMTAVRTINRYKEKEHGRT